MFYVILKYLCPLLAAVVVVLAIWLARLKRDVSERGVALDCLLEAYMGLEAAGPVRELGRSFAIINHNSKNHMAAIYGYTMLLQRSKNLGIKEREMVDGIAEAAARLQSLSQSVLEASRSNDVSENAECNLEDAINACISRRFRKETSKFAVSRAASDDAVLISGNLNKLERAFASAFCNSLEAGARNISVRMSVYNRIALVVIDDDGEGCDAARLRNISTALFTSKRRPGNMGFGLCVMRATVEAHNGNVSIYSKNLLRGGARGLIVQITIPTSPKMPSTMTKSEVMLVKQGLNDETVAICAVLKNLKIIPHIAETPQHTNLGSRSASLALTVIAAAPQAAALREQAGGNSSIRILALKKGAEGTLTAAVDENKGDGELFTEEYIVNYNRSA